MTFLRASPVGMTPKDCRFVSDEAQFKAQLFPSSRSTGFSFNLIVKDSYWRWPERNLSGNAIDFFVRVVGREHASSEQSDGQLRQLPGRHKIGAPTLWHRQPTKPFASVPGQWVGAFEPLAPSAT